MIVVKKFLHNHTSQTVMNGHFLSSISYFMRLIMKESRKTAIRYALTELSLGSYERITSGDKLETLVIHINLTGIIPAPVGTSLSGSKMSLFGLQKNESSFNADILSIDPLVR